MVYCGWARDRELTLAVSCCAEYPLSPGMARWGYALLCMKGYGLIYWKLPRYVGFEYYAERVLMRAVNSTSI